MRHTQRVSTWAAAAALICALSGCRQGPRPIAGADSPLPGGEASAEFIDRVEGQVNVNQNDAFRGVLLLLESKDESKGFGERARKLIDRGIVPDSWELDALKPLRREQLAYMICKGVKADGGVWHSLYGHTLRYCLQEMQHQGFIVQGLGNTPVSGSEFVAVLARADAYLQQGEIPEALKPKQ